MVVKIENETLIRHSCTNEPDWYSNTKLIMKENNNEILYNSEKSTYIIYNNELLICKHEADGGNLHIKFNINYNDNKQQTLFRFIY